MQVRLQTPGPKNCEAFEDIKAEARQYLESDKDLLARFEIFFRKTCSSVEAASKS
jgi:hypothetical protein